MTHLIRARDIREPPVDGSPYSVACEGTEQPGRSKIYRHWRFPDKLLETLDPRVSKPEP
jgi:long-chain acyl-CoA synthetase